MASGPSPPNPAVLINLAVIAALVEVTDQVMIEVSRTTPRGSQAAHIGSIASPCPNWMILGDQQDLGIDKQERA